MELELNNLKEQFDETIKLIKNTEEYLNYQNAKQILLSSEKAEYILSKIKELQKSRLQCKKKGELALVEEISEAINTLHTEYDLLFEVSQFNSSYEELKRIITPIKEEIENKFK